MIIAEEGREGEGESEGGGTCLISNGRCRKREGGLKE